ncbi:MULTISPECIES: glycosyltransferase family 4 protein [unclassified Clostridium]|uniref:glycosyltransferase family 4 protein n=1 Tax=unclassified Clostridium TaxID=2614128 RepID=UPI0020792301|nr:MULTISPECIES: glycosyltransferase family 4 protein [unclassified Clostridium]
MEKICFVIDSMKNSGGRERVISILSNEFIKSFHVSIVVLDNSIEHFYDINKNINIVSTGGVNKMQKIIGLHRYLKNNEDYIYITLSMRFLNLFVAASSIFTKAKIIATEHCDYFATPMLFRILKRIFYKKFKYVVTLTEKDKNIIKKWFKNVEQINNPTSFYPEHASKLNNKVILNVGRLTKQKGQDMLIEAWSKVNKKDWKLVIVGDGELKDDLLNKISDLQLDNTVEIQSPTSNIQDIYLSSDIFVLSSRWEGLPMVLIESMACGLPCVSFDCETGPRQLIKSGYNGYLVEPNDIDELAKNIAKLINSRNNILTFGLNSKIEAQKYLIENIAKKWYVLIQRISI